MTLATRCFVFLLYILNIRLPHFSHIESERILYMKFYILASLIIFALVISHNLRKYKKIQSDEKMSFWQREQLANSTRRKSLDGLEYIRISPESLPIHTMEDDPQVAECLRVINDLSLQPVVNLTGLTNTDLKLEYGTANITALTEYDQNYTRLVSTLQRWADLLYNGGFPNETRQILEFALSTRTDVSRSYDLLADIYLQSGQPEKLAGLLQTAETLNSLNKEVILRHLKAKADRFESCQ